MKFINYEVNILSKRGKSENSVWVATSDISMVEIEKQVIVISTKSGRYLFIHKNEIDKDEIEKAEGEFKYVWCEKFDNLSKKLERVVQGRVRSIWKHLTNRQRRQ